MFRYSLLLQVLLLTQTLNPRGIFGNYIITLYVSPAIPCGLNVVVSGLSIGCSDGYEDRMTMSLFLLDSMALVSRLIDSLITRHGILIIPRCSADL
jgi:hypothetical protein